MSYFPTTLFEVDLSRISERCHALKKDRELHSLPNKKWVIFKNGTVVAVPDELDPEVFSKKAVLECMCQHPDFNVISTNEKIPCHILVMNQWGSAEVVTYLFDDEWQKAKQTKASLCEAEVLLGTDPESEFVRLGTYARLRIFADGKDPQVYEIV